MAAFNIAGKVQTVLGLVDPSELGVTFTHDHLLVSTDHMVDPPAEASARNLYAAPVSLESLAYRKYHFGRVAAVSGLEDVDTAIDEANLFKQYGGGTIVEPSSMGIGRDPVGLARISRATGVKIIMGGSYYVDAAHPADMGERDESELVEKIVTDIVEGVDGTGIRSGVIGEVGCTWPLTDNERKVLRASGRAQRITGAPLLIHPGRNEFAPLEIIEILSEVDADLGHTIIGHLDRTVFEKSTLRQNGRERHLHGVGPVRQGRIVLRREHVHRYARRRQAHGRHSLDSVRRLRGQDSGGARHRLERPSDGLWRARLLLHPEPHSAAHEAARVQRRCGDAASWWTTPRG